MHSKHNGRRFVAALKDRIDNDPTLSPAGLAIKAGLDNSTIRGLLTGKARAPNLETALKICAALDTTLEEFMGEARTPVERDILRLVGRLPDDLRRQLLGYGQALERETDQRPPDSSDNRE